MAQKVVAMETKLLAVFSSLAEVNVAAVCRELEISRQTFYKYKRRFQEEGPAGLAERSRRPIVSPAMIPVELEDEIVRLRKALPVDNGAQTIAYHLARAGWEVPAVSTIHRALVRRGQVVPQPHKRPRSAWRRFEWPAPNDAWQIDATCWALANGAEVWIMDVLDDHSRVLIAARVCSGPTVTAAWDAFSHGAGEWGLPAHVMSDNGACFTSRLRKGRETVFEANLRALGVRHIASSPGHPQTCGKLERSHQTTKEWLDNLPPAGTPDQLQDQLDDWRRVYNFERPHSALDGATPLERWHASLPAVPGDRIPDPPAARLGRVTATGVISWGRALIGVGTEHAGSHLLVVARGDHVTVWGRGGLIRELTIDPSRTYQPTGKPPGRRLKRLLGPCS
jgi:transposase InsO family protein